ncbi:bifunctional 2-polyprenyl-6-hydroxyphenol methylase/3-demethylubiquinol 3-O-methyltransferase UbiG [Geobacter sp. AOG2]|uniref:class I SAM-dependent methyltransferase n=1 Tax=Geobacter sp. AOG2 TaxID=1566347 RepID=UPI001CC49795|nr:class I SAM-dependent methyltransferase [Geobacter sp. AOG2]GFE61643.1 SAM-dependent methyltransferase [Geobacter sp. AOG2]
MEADRIKWNERFGAEGAFLGERPSPFLAREIERILRLAPGRRALDVACGEGRNSIFLARHGFRTSGLDISDVGIAKAERLAHAEALEIDFHQVDLENCRIAGQYDLIINFNFLLRSLIPEEVGALAPGGLLLFDTILESPQLLVTHNPDFFLRYGELERIFAVFNGEVLFSEEDREGEMPTARLLYRKAD